MNAATDTASQVAYLARVLKTPTIARTFADLADRARDAGWTHEEYLAAVLARQVADREASGAAIRLHRRLRRFSTNWTAVAPTRSG